MAHKSEIQNVFNKTDCPSDDLLIRYAHHNANKDEIRRVELHLTDCEICSDMVEGLQSGISLDAFKSNVAELAYNSKNLEQQTKIVPLQKRKNNYFAIAASLLLFVSVGLLLRFLLSENSHSNSISSNEIPKAESPTPSIDKEVKNAPLEEEQVNPKSIIPAEPLKKKAPTILNTESQHDEQVQENTSYEKDRKKSVDANLSSGQAEFEKNAVAESVIAATEITDENAESKDIVVRGGRSEETLQNYSVQASQAPAASTTEGAAAPSSKSDKFILTDLQKAKDEFQAGNYEKAKSMLLTYKKSNSANEEVIFYLGKTERMLKNFSSSNTYFKSLFQNKKGAFSSESEWLYALNLVDLKDNKRAKEHLKKIAAEGGKYAYPAAEMMGELEK